MNEQVRNRMEIVRLRSMHDPVYRDMLMDLRQLEKQFMDVVGKLSHSDYGIIADYISQCEEMSWRMLELACTYMRFPDHQDLTDFDME